MKSIFSNQGQEIKYLPTSMHTKLNKEKLAKVIRENLEVKYSPRKEEHSIVFGILVGAIGAGLVYVILVMIFA